MLKNKIRNKKSGILFYGLTPPKATNTEEQIKVITQKHIDRILPLEIDGLILYDIQDESDRTNKKRPFPFIKTLDSTDYANDYLNVLNLPIVVYKAVGKYDKKNMSSWLEESKKSNSYSVFVGAASDTQKSKMSIKDAYALKKDINSDLVLGGITIPERHSKKKDEHLRVFSKTDNGCEFFVSQAVYDLHASKKFLDDYSSYAKENNKEIVPIIFTLTPCGSVKTLEFMKWLGIHIPELLERKLMESGNILDDSVKFSIAIFESLYTYGLQKGIPIGCNVESVAIRKEEIDASIELLNEVQKIMKRHK
ncbi:5,10-methylenetetrahydrofolate reductase [Arcobacter sp. HD9-500m-PIT-SAG03]|nr:5,10-methylenetetrahydrofolate reductase [Arcobacter sp. HD9-500m-PIT-SAG03]